MTVVKRFEGVGGTTAQDRLRAARTDETQRETETTNEAVNPDVKIDNDPS
jgi:hypothetical protein